MLNQNAFSLPAYPFMVACLCAQWCSTCQDYRLAFESIARAFPEWRFIWLDIEDDVEVVDPIDVVNFPTILIALGDEPLFFGPLTPKPETLRRLLQSHAETSANAVLDSPDLKALIKKLHKHEDLRGCTVARVELKT